MKQVYAMVVALTLFSCSGQVEQDGHDEPASERNMFNADPDSIVHLQGVMINNSRCTLEGRNKMTTPQELIGYWEDTLSWVTNNDDSCWYGVNYLNRDVHLEIKPNDVYVLRYEYSNGPAPFVYQGRFELVSDTIDSEIKFSVNENFETEDALEKWIEIAEFQIRWSSTLGLMLIPPLQDNMDEYEILEFNKTKPNKNHEQ
jgi:hypothetical protein